MRFDRAEATGRWERIAVYCQVHGSAAPCVGPLRIPWVGNELRRHAPCTGQKTVAPRRMSGQRKTKGSGLSMIVRRSKSPSPQPSPGVPGEGVGRAGARRCNRRESWVEGRGENSSVLIYCLLSTALLSRAAPPRGGCKDLSGFVRRGPLDGLGLTAVFQYSKSIPAPPKRRVLALSSESMGPSSKRYPLMFQCPNRRGMFRRLLSE